MNEKAYNKTGTNFVEICPCFVIGKEEEVQYNENVKLIRGGFFYYHVLKKSVKDDCIDLESKKRKK